MTNPATETATPLVRSLRAPGPWTLVDILDGRQLRVQLTAAALEHVGDDAALKARARDLLHGALFRGRLIAQERLEQGADGLDTARLLAAVQDEVLSALYDFTTTHVFRSRNPTEAERLAVFATGGYGRGVLAPSSDIDLLFVRPYKSAAWAESVIEYMLYMLWDMGLKVGHAYRTLDECIRLSKSDVTIKTAFMDARFLFGDEALADDIRARFDREAVKGRDGEFIAAKLAERDARHARQGHTRYVVEPNVKDGKGGLRDLQTLYWIAKHVYGGDTLEDVLGARVFTPHEYKVFLRAARFFWTVRCHLHYLTGRAEERISFDLQPELAKRLGYRDRAGRLGVERFMKRYFVAAKDVGGLTRILAAKLDAEHNKPSPLRRLFPGGAPKPLGPAGFLVDQGRLTVSGPEVFSSDPRNLLRLFGLAVDEGLDVHPDAMIWASRLVKEIRDETRRDPEAGELFMDAVLGGEHPGAALRMMNEAGVLGRFLPEFGGIVAQTQFNMYHYYTVDEHTLRAVEAISDIEHRRGDFPPLASDLFEQIHHRRALYLAMLLHDTGKGQGDQQIEGAKTARAAAERLGLPEAEQDLIAWLVGHHLVMSETAQKRDISDPRTVAGFAETVGSLERLRLLYILTIADITAVGPGVWNGWKGQLLAELYHAAAAALRGGRTDEASVASELDELATRRRAALLERLGAAPAIMFEMEPAYWTGFDLEALAWHAEALSKTDGPVAATRATDANGATMLLASGPDRPGLFADLVGTVAAEGGDVVTAQVFTSDTGRIIDVFAIQDRNGEVFAAGDANRVQRLEAAILNTLRGDAPQPPEETPSGRREAAFLVRPSVTLLASASASNLVIDLEARDRALLLYDVARTLAENGCSIQSAHIGSYGERVFDAFYVQRTDGGQFDDAMKKTLRRRLLDLLARDEPDAPETPARRLARSRAADSF
ncbi:MAG: [protein-PII] uridylyltransferase [Pseudomonadota bacterium]